MVGTVCSVVCNLAHAHDTAAEDERAEEEYDYDEEEEEEVEEQVAAVLASIAERTGPLGVGATSH
eukprot:CAMPEP_0172857234 /NCGR_PEP_ID=MMETSP1075-20121228/64504_1 /TAXON_ID=2916 /ORGANISM="Ceratium fusus, Strain PA161109" /LENGTH=64 /DNA_ID=CAMNT_0013704527 /DNA_START=14 /DNA_END=206 /DNA_ORIENTATION=+